VTVSCPHEESRSPFKRQAITIGINAFDYRKPGYNPNNSLDEFDFECIGTKITRVMQLSEQLNVPIDLHLTFFQLIANRPDLWNHWIHDTAPPPRWVQDQAQYYRTTVGATDYIEYVRELHNSANTNNVDWVRTGVEGESSTKAMKTFFIGWYGTGLYTAPRLNIGSIAVKNAVREVIVSQVLPYLKHKFDQWYAAGKDYLLAGFTSRWEDGFHAQLCRANVTESEKKRILY
jgi:hypothetical protein